MTAKMARKSHIVNSLSPNGLPFLQDSAGKPLTAIDADPRKTLSSLMNSRNQFVYKVFSNVDD